jgi:hypothetical protein
MEVTVQDGRVVWLQGNARDPAIGASLCAKGSAGLALEFDDQRPQTPLIRKGPRGSGQWRRASWDEALDYIADKLHETIAEFGGRGIVLSDRGGPFTDLTRTFVQALGSPNYFNHGWGGGVEVQGQDAVLVLDDGLGGFLPLAAADLSCAPLAFADAGIIPSPSSLMVMAQGICLVKQTRRAFYHHWLLAAGEAAPVRGLLARAARLTTEITLATGSSGKAMCGASRARRVCAWNAIRRHGRRRAPLRPPGLRRRGVEDRRSLSQVGFSGLRLRAEDLGPARGGSTDGSDRGLARSPRGWFQPG